SLIFIGAFINNLRFHLLDYDLSTWGMAIAATIFVLGFTAMNFRVTQKVYNNYKVWRQLWCDFWDLMKLVSMSRESAAMEYGFRAIDKYLHKIDFERDDTDQLIEKIVEKYSLSITIPTDSERKKRVMLNICLYHICKDALDNPNPKFLELQQKLHFQERANNIINAIQDLTSADAHTDLAIATFFATLPNTYKLPVEMFNDLEPLLTRNWIADSEDYSLSVNQLEYLEGTPQRIIPDSLRWLPAIIPISLWLASILLVQII
ncbi:MAG: hypothetical protein ACTSWA_07575, partial [Candidatus Thorarchaeota archaeon]